ncbi:MAG TPA: hypothetical protein PKC80_02075 [Burkholderiaceae bacterium]|nr:hypothetical protein [Burkholderiaceae bacterium]
MLDQLKRIHLKLLFIFGLSVAVTIAGCGGDSAPADAADPYVGTWKSQCFAWLGNYEVVTRTASKLSATQLVGTVVNTKKYSDAACTILVSTDTTSESGVYTIGNKATFLGQSVDSYKYDSTTTPGSGYQGFAVLNGSGLYVAASFTSEAPTAWWTGGIPYVKQ